MKGPVQEGIFSDVSRFAKGEADSLYGVPRQSALAFFLGLLTGALVMGASSFNATERAYLRCMRSDPRLGDNRDCSTSLTVAKKELADATGRVEQLSQRCGLCNDCKAVTSKALGKAEAEWLKEKHRINEAQTEAVRAQADAEARANEVEAQCDKRISAASAVSTRRAEEDAEVHRQEAALKASQVEAQLRQAAVDASKARDAAEQDRDAAREEHEGCIGRLHSASEAHLSTNRTHAALQSDLEMGVATARAAAVECEARHSEAQTSLCYVCRTCGASVKGLPACSRCQGHR